MQATSGSVSAPGNWCAQKLGDSLHTLSSDRDLWKRKMGGVIDDHIRHMRVKDVEGSAALASCHPRSHAGGQVA
eukprot:2053771-Amphidinium_carterae.1